MRLMLLQLEYLYSALYSNIYDFNKKGPKFDFAVLLLKILDFKIDYKNYRQI